MEAYLHIYSCMSFTRHYRVSFIHVVIVCSYEVNILQLIWSVVDIHLSHFYFKLLGIVYCEHITSFDECMHAHIPIWYIPKKQMFLYKSLRYVWV